MGLFGLNNSYLLGHTYLLIGNEIELFITVNIFCLNGEYVYVLILTYNATNKICCFWEIIEKMRSLADLPVLNLSNGHGKFSHSWNFQDDPQL